MNIFEYAMQMEKEGEAYYRELADKTDDTSLKTILIMMADEEVKHYNTFKALKENASVEFEDSSLFKNVKTVFEKAREAGDKFNSKEEAADHYTKARDVEKEAEEFYREKAKEVEGLPKKYLTIIADEEHRHYKLLDNLIDLVQKPDMWMENAEWNNMQEY